MSITTRQCLPLLGLALSLAWGCASDKEDKDEVNRLKFGVQRQLIENKSNELEAAAKIVLAEAEG